MALPCFCYRCAFCISQESRKNEECLAIEKMKVCKTNDCDNCSFMCSRFTTVLAAKGGKLGDLV